MFMIRQTFITTSLGLSRDYCRSAKFKINNSNSIIYYEVAGRNAIEKSKKKKCRSDTLL